MDTQEACDRIAVMRRQEEEVYRCSDYLSVEHVCMSIEAETTRQDPPHRFTSRAIDSDCRRKMADWCFQVVDFCKFSRETVDVAIGYLDRYLGTFSMRSSLAHNSRKEFQLVAMTALYLAVKINEPLEMDTELVSELSKGSYSAREVAETESDILNALNWRLSRPTALGFVRHFLSLLPNTIAEGPGVSKTLLELSRFQTELAVSDYYFVTKNASDVAFAAILNSMEAVALDPTEKLQYIVAMEVVSNSNLSSCAMGKVQSRLMGAFVKSCGYDFRLVPLNLDVSTVAAGSPKRRFSMDGEASPVYVSDLQYQ